MGPQDLLFRRDGLQLTEIAGHCCFFASVIQDQGPAAHNRRAIRSRLRIAMCHALRRRAKGPISARLSQTRGHWRPPFCCSKHQRSMDCALKRRSPSPPTRNAGILCYFRRRVPVIQHHRQRLSAISSGPYSSCMSALLTQPNCGRRWRSRLLAPARIANPCPTHGGAVLGDVYPALISRSGEVCASKSVCLLCMSRMRAAVCSSARLLLGSPPPFDRRRSGPTSESAAERACLRIA